MPISLLDLELDTTHGKVNLSQSQAKFLVLYFYPKDNTPGCTIESKDFRDHYTDFTQLGAVIYGISRDNMASHHKFNEVGQFPFALISDVNGQLCQHFSVLKRKIYGFGIERSTFLFKASELLHEWRGVKVSGHVQAVLTAIKDNH